MNRNIISCPSIEKNQVFPSQVRQYPHLRSLEPGLETLRADVCRFKFLWCNVPQRRSELVRPPGWLTAAVPSLLTAI